MYPVKRYTKHFVNLFYTPMKNSVECLILIDDDDITNSLHLMLLEDLQVAEEVHIATDGEKALSLVRELLIDNDKSKPDNALIFLDINMPGLSGFELLKEMDKLESFDWERLQVYLLTSSSSRRDMEEADLYRVAGYLDKPLTEEKVRRAVNALAKQSS